MKNRRAVHSAALTAALATFLPCVSAQQAAPPRPAVDATPATGIGASATADAGASGFDVPRHRWLLQTSLYTRHFHYDPAHNDHQRMLNLEYQREDNWLAGGAIFRNSFDQPTQYLYLGKLWRPFSDPAIHLKLTGGLLHGYKDQYRDKIPFNHSGTAPVILPSIGYSTRRFTSELILFGTNGIMIAVGVYLN